MLTIPEYILSTPQLEVYDNSKNKNVATNMKVTREVTKSMKIYRETYAKDIQEKSSEQARK